MGYLADLLARRSADPRFDEELWSFADRVIVERQGNPLQNLREAELQERLASIEKNIQMLETGSSARDDLVEARGWLSPWWWLRARHWTLLELQRRGVAPAPSVAIKAPISTHPDFHGTMDGGKRLLIRISRVPWLLDTLEKGRLRFTPAASYDDPALNAARADDEMRRQYKRPGQVLTITGPDGSVMPIIGDATFSRERKTWSGARGTEHPYWMLSFSSDLDPRLVDDFASGDPSEDGCLVIFDVDAFLRRALPKLVSAAPHAGKKLAQNEYFDPRYPPSEPLDVLLAKDFRYAYQREIRFILDPEGGPPLAGGGLLSVNIGQIADIAAVYRADGAKVAGTGPDSFLA